MTRLKPEVYNKSKGHQEYRMKYLKKKRRVLIGRLRDQKAVFPSFSDIHTHLATDGHGIRWIKLYFQSASLTLIIRQLYYYNGTT